ncbi:hypothetical protein B0A52_03597 [Exophiala mesophila]|uniref:Xylanolytic transcriptional activator regulatory domain-containing protein n=1 Tax=Exophiala mesophila TaxID=212818 RepID=A0A438N9E7_EXOME|nr:hypothetical protein B0A52_03597 [Exophiala mesophila]
MEERYEIFSSPDCSQMSFQNSEHATWGLIEDNAGPPLEDLIGDFVPQSASNVTAQNVSQSAEFDPEIYALFATPPKGDQAVQYVVGTASGVENPVVSPALQASPSSAGCSDDSYNIIPENYGRESWLSVCSPSGIAWIQNQVASDDFTNIASDLTASWSKQLRLSRNEAAQRGAEPQADLAWKYTHAYFERSVDSLFEVIHRPEFEHHLRSHLSNRLYDDDPAWLALRNTVFVSIQQEAWHFFSNALSVHSDLLLRSPSIRAVRALLAMALFAEGLGSPALGSGLVANASLVAQSLGLHRGLPALGQPSTTELLQRRWLFWAVYCCEKNISQRTGRPSVIDDNDIGCEVPTEVHPDSTIDPLIFTSIIQTCQISSRLCRQLISTRHLQDQPSKLMDIVNGLDNELRTWKANLPSRIMPQDELKHFQTNPISTNLALILLHCSYYDLIMATHTIFVYPWSIRQPALESNPDLAAKLRAQIRRSSEAVATAARNIIIMARNFDINGACTHAFMLHFPMHAFINLFIYVIRFPTLKSVRGDLALLDVSTGYFGQMEFVTGSELSFTFAREIAGLARRAVSQAHQQR